MFENLLGKMIGLNELLGATFTDEENEMISCVVRKFFFMFDDNADLIQFYHVFGMSGFKKLYKDCHRMADHEARLHSKVDEFIGYVDKLLEIEVEARKSYCDLKYEWGIGLAAIADCLASSRKYFSDAEIGKEAIIARLKKLEDYTRELIGRCVDI